MPADLAGQDAGRDRGPGVRAALWRIATGQDTAGESVSEGLRRSVCEFLHDRRRREDREAVTYALDLPGGVRAPVEGRVRMPPLDCPDPASTH